MRFNAPFRVQPTTDFVAMTGARRFRRAWLLLLLVGLVVLSAAGGPPTAGAAGIALHSQQALSSFPNGIVFKVSASSDARITQARLRFQIMPTGPITLLNVDCDGGTPASCSKTVGGANGIYIVPFTTVRYAWELQDDKGGTLTTAESTVTYDDNRFDWKSVTEGNLTVYYYSGDVSTMREILRVGRETIERMSKVTGTTIDFPVKVLDYASARDLQPAVASSRFGGGNSITLGEVASKDTAIETRQTFGSNSDPMDTVRHELAHVVTDHATRGNPNLDIWINEGISMWAQQKLDSAFRTALERTIRNNSAQTIVSLNSVQLRSNNPNLFYSQSYSLINFLIETYGESKFTSFIQALNTSLTNEALRRVYGFDTEGLDAAWRKSVGLPERPAIDSANTGQLGALPTIVPFGANGTTAKPSDGSTPQTTDGEASALPARDTSAFALAPMLVAVAGLGLLVVLIVMRKRTRTRPGL